MSVLSNMNIIAPEVVPVIMDGFSLVEARKRKSAKSIMSLSKLESVKEVAVPIPSEPSLVIDNDFPVLGAQTRMPQKKERKAVSIPARSQNVVAAPVDLSSTLRCTKPCSHVTNPASGTDEFGVCFREYCTFAHSLAELEDPQCTFGDRCRFIYGRRDYSGQLDRSRKCMFKHPKESREEYAERTGRPLPHLPATSENSRKPTTKLTKPVRPNQVKPVLKNRPTYLKPIQPKPVEQTPVPTPKDSEVVIRVPKCIAEGVLELALMNGITNFRIDTFE